MLRLFSHFFTYSSLALILVFCYSLRALGLRALQKLGHGLGDLLYILHFRRKVVSSNLRLALGKELSAQELQSLTRKVFRHIGLLFLEIARNFALTKEEMQREIQLLPEDALIIEEALSRGRGLIFISAHIANWELLAMSIASRGAPSSIVVKKMNNRLSQALIERQRKKTGLGIIYSGGTIEKMKEALKAGTMIGFMVDQNTTGKKGIRANFFGVPASSIRGLSALVCDTGVPVIPICAIRQPDGQHIVKLLPELPYLKAENISDPAERALREEFLNTQQYQKAIEDLIRLQPDQWLWIHRRWKADRTPLNMETAHRMNA